MRIRIISKISVRRATGDAVSKRALIKPPVSGALIKPPVSGDLIKALLEVSISCVGA